ncbi:unnamed protein product, partial [Ostreobium quekettii]
IDDNQNHEDYLIKPGFPVGIKQGGKYYINNHLIFSIYVHPTHGQFSNYRQEAERLAASSIDGRRLLLSKDDVRGVDTAYVELSDAHFSGRSLQQLNEGKYADWNDTQVKTSMYMIVGFEVYPCSVRHDPDSTVEAGKQCLGEPADEQEIQEG